MGGERMKRFENVTLLVDKGQGEMRILMDERQDGAEILENEYLCTVEVKSEEEKE